MSEYRFDATVKRIPELLRFLGLHLALGAAIAVAFVSLIILLDLAGLRRLLMETDQPFVPLLLLYSFNVITFSSVAMGIGIMTLPKGESEPAPAPRRGSDGDDASRPIPPDATPRRRR